MTAPRVPKKLAAEWAAKLADSGFVDIERMGRLPYAQDVLRRGVERAEIAGRPDYYRRAGQYASEAVFSSRVVRLVWELHAEGLPGHDIQRALGPARGHMAPHVLALIRKERPRMADWLRSKLGLDEPNLSLAEQHLEAEGYGSSTFGHAVVPNPYGADVRAIRKQGPLERSGNHGD